MDQVTDAPRVYTKQEAALIERYRDINVSDDWWWECVRGDAEEDLAEIGFTMSRMYFSGFWSQGDGACFEGTMRDWGKFCEKVPEFCRDFPFLSEYLKDEGGTYSIAHQGHYYHENCTTHDYSTELENSLEDLGDAEHLTDPDKQMRHAMWTKAFEEEGTTYQTTGEDVTNWLKDFFKDKMRDLYRSLEKEHEYMTSDDAVWDTIEANDLDKQDVLDEEGEDDETTD